jgi:hypothetical protein
MYSDIGKSVLYDPCFLPSQVTKLGTHQALFLLVCLV